VFILIGGRRWFEMDVGVGADNGVLDVAPAGMLSGVLLIKVVGLL